MAEVKNLIHETTVSTGATTLTLVAVNGRVRFSDSTYGFGTGGTDVFYYFISNRNAAEWEIGTGHMSDANTLVRDTVIASSNADAAVNFSAGTKDVTNAFPADFLNRTSKNPPVDADRVFQGDSTASFEPVYSTWTQVKAFLKTYFDTLYELAGAIATHAAVTATHGATGAVVGTTNTQTLINKRITARIGTTASSSTPTPSADNHDQYNVTALAVAATFGAPTGTPTNGQGLIIRIKDNGTARALAWNAIYRAIVALPTTTVISKTLYVGFIYNAADSKWDCVAAQQEA